MPCINVGCVAFCNGFKDNCMAYKDVNKCDKFKKAPCQNNQCGSYNATLKDNCVHGWSGFKSFYCKDYI